MCKIHCGQNSCVGKSRFYLLVLVKFVVGKIRLCVKSICGEKSPVGKCICGENSPVGKSICGEYSPVGKNLCWENSCGKRRVGKRHGTRGGRWGRQVRVYG